MNQPEELLNTRRFRVVRHWHQTIDGATHAREVILHPGAVTILPLVESDKICLIRNYRSAVEQTLIELPAGTLEPGEDPAQTARRELREETGYAAEKMTHLHDFWMSPGILRERMHLYLATGLTLGTTNLDAGEQIEAFLVSWAEALDLIRQGQIQDAKTLVGLLYYDRWRTAE